MPRRTWRAPDAARSSTSTPSASLGRHVLIAHGVHLDDAELDILLRTETALAYCPWAYLRLGQGVTGAGRHAEFVERGGRLALGCDAENAGDAVDVLARRGTRRRAGPATRGVDADRFGAHAALELATIAGAEAIGLGDEIGSLEVGKRADVVVVDTTGPGWTPPSADPVLGLIWGGGGASVTRRRGERQGRRRGSALPDGRRRCPPR